MNTVLYVHHGKGWGGAPKSLNLLLANLDRSRYDPYVLCHYEGEAADAFRRTIGKERVIVDERLTTYDHTVQAWYRPYRPYFWTYFVPSVFGGGNTVKFALEHMRKIKPRIVHLNSTSLIYEGMAARKFGAKVVLHAREPLSQGHFRIRYNYLRHKIIEISDAIIGISNNDLGPPFARSSKAVVITNPIEDTSDVDRNFQRTKLKIESKTFVIGYVGFSVDKGIFEFLKAAELAAPKNPNMKFLFIGLQRDMPESLVKKIEAYARKPALMGRFVLMGGRPFAYFIPRPETYIAAMDAICIPYAIPHFARVILEAFGLGVAVAAYNWGGLNEILKGGTNGLAIRPLDVKGMANAFVKLAGDPVDAARMGENALAQAKASFTGPAHARLVMRVYDRLLNIKVSE